MDDKIAILNNESYNGKKVYSVTFDNRGNAEIGLSNILLFVALNKRKIVGKGYRE